VYKNTVNTVTYVWGESMGQLACAQIIGKNRRLLVSEVNVTGSTRERVQREMADVRRRLPSARFGSGISALEAVAHTPEGGFVGRETLVAAIAELEKTTGTSTAAFPLIRELSRAVRGCVQQ